MPRQNAPYYCTIQRLSSVLLLLLLLWLGVSTPFVYAAQQQHVSGHAFAGGDDGAPLSGANEEQPETGVSTVSEYLHEVHHYLHQVVPAAPAYKCSPDGLYAAFHPELLVPPPNRVC